MIQFIDKLLLDWARWSRIRRDGGLGFPSSVAICVRVSGGQRGDIIGIDEQSLEIDLIIAMLKKSRSELFSLVEYYYLKEATGHEIANRLKCSRDTVYVRLHQVHQFVMDAMHDNEIERQDAADELKNQKKFAKVA
ncbi:antiterminator Q family protein [Undibacterium sp. MH2W]|uniref:antiterminator Q family protein n=1 Tax=Undibacterium sp. MH2W TaxID=3413044 RepID=UPI003BF1D306